MVAKIYCINILSNDGHTDGGRKEVCMCVGTLQEMNV